MTTYLGYPAAHNKQTSPHIYSLMGYTLYFILYETTYPRCVNTFNTHVALSVIKKKKGLRISSPVVNSETIGLY